MNVIADTLSRSPARLFVLTCGIALGTVAVASAQTGGTTGTASVRGQRLYAARCASCHGANLQGGGGPALVRERAEALKRLAGYSQAFWIDHVR